MYRPRRTLPQKNVVSVSVAVALFLRCRRGHRRRAPTDALMVLLAFDVLLLGTHQQGLILRHKHRGGVLPVLEA